MTKTHIPRWLLFLLILPALFSCSPQWQPSGTPQVRQGILDLRDWSFGKDGPVALRGDWAFYWKQLLSPQDLQKPTRSSPTGWFPVPQVWNEYTVQGRSLPGAGYATFRIRVLLPRANQVYGLYLDYQRTAYKLWVDTQEVATNGMVGTSAAYMTPMYRPQVQEFHAARQRVEITLQVSNYYHPKGGFKNAIWLGTPRQIGAMRENATFFELLLIGSLLTMALYHFILFFYRRKEYALLYLAISCLVIALRQFVINGILLVHLFPGLPWEVLLKLDYITFYLAPPLLYLYLRHVFPKDFPALIQRVVLWCTTIACSFTLLLPFRLHRYILPPYQFFTLLFLITVSILILRALQQKRELAALIFVGGMILILAGINDILHAQGVLHTRTLTPLALLLFIFCQSIVLAIRFQRMAQELYARSARLERYLTQVTLDIEERQKGAAESVAIYLPLDRRLALAHGQELTSPAQGAVMFADISGFTPMTESLARELGRQRGVEELIRQINRVYESLIAEVHRYGGCVINFSGDAITCWFPKSPMFPNTPAQRSTYCAMAMQTSMRPYHQLATPAGTTLSLHIKIAVVSGSVRRMLVGDPAILSMEALVGQALDHLALGEQLARPDEILLDEATAQRLSQVATFSEWRSDTGTGLQFAVVAGLTGELTASPWPAIPPNTLSEEQVRPWILKPIYEKVLDGQSNYLSELRTVSALFLQFQGIDYEQDAQAEHKLDQFLCWLQHILEHYHGSLLQLITGDKGSYLYAVFGAPIHHQNDATQAVLAALRLQKPPPELSFVSKIQIGLARGQMRTGPYGSPSRRTYGAVGPKTNLAARLMVAAKEHILCDASIYEAAQDALDFVPLEPIQVKGKSEPVTIYKPVTPESWDQSLIDQLPPGPQLTLKVASLLGDRLDHSLLQAIYPVESERSQVPQYIQVLRELRLLLPDPQDPKHISTFLDPIMQETACSLMLFAQRRQLHRDAAAWYEAQSRDNLKPHYERLLYHWEQAEDTNKTIHYLEKVGEQLRQRGQHQQAMPLFNKALHLDSQASVLNADLYREIVGHQRDS